MSDVNYDSLVWDAEMEEWTGELPIPELAEFDASAEETVLKQERVELGLPPVEEAVKADGERLAAGMYSLRIHNRMQNREPTRCQREALMFFVANRPKIVENSLAAIFGWYANWVDETREAELEFGESREDVEALYPRIEASDELRTLIKLECVDVHEASRGGLSDIGFSFETCWDDEHGLGVLVNRVEVVAVGFQDVAFQDRYETILDGTEWKMIAEASP